MSIRTYIEPTTQKKLYEVYVNGFDARGVRIQRKRRALETLRKAEVAEFELKRELAQLKEQRVPFRWNEWLNECIRRMKLGYAPSTILGYQGQLGKWVSPHWGHLELQQIDSHEVHRLIFEKLGDRLTLNSKQKILKMIRRVFEMAVEDGALDRNPCVGIKVRVPEVDSKVLTNNEVEIFLREARLTQHRFFPIWFVALSTGMRSGELMALTWTDVDFDNQTLSVSKQWTNKTGFGPTKSQKTRVVPISDDLATFLREWKLSHSADSTFVLPHLIEWQNGEQSRITREFCTAIGVTAVKFHDLRATFITNLLARGVALAQVMAVVGHSQLKTTNGYLRKAGVEVRGVTNNLGYRLPKFERAQVLKLMK